MRFDSTPYYHVGEDYDWETLVDEMREEVRLMDQGGFTGIWLAEHHFHWDGWYRASPNPILLGADLINESDRLRVGQCGTILPDWNPIRVAEDIAMLDQLTRGRVDFGVARGINNRATIQFREEADRRNEQHRSLFNETLEVILGAWRNDAFSYKGEFFTYPAPGWQETNPLGRDPRFHSETGELKALGLTPKPFQRPHPPVFNMVESSSSHAYSARMGIGAMCFSISHGRIKDAWRAYNNAASETAGHDVPYGQNLAVMRPTYIADSYEQAVADAREGTNLLASWITTDPDKVRKIMVSEEELEEGDLDLDWFDFQLKHDLILVGSPDSVSEQIERLETETGCPHLAFFLNIPLLSFQQVMHSLDLASSKVIPRFA